MPKVIGVRFRTSPRMYYFAPTEGEQYVKDMQVVVETQRGVELATVVMPITEVTEDKIVAPLKPIVRIATDDDIRAVTADNDQKQEILAVAKQKVAARGLDMKIVDCEFTVDHSKLVLYFTAEQRVDFRELVRDLASAFRNRIDLRQIGARDECKLIGSLGSCGMPCCCGRFESDSAHVSIKMAKNQNLALTPNKINGMCGRLLCCLAYENKTYEDVIKRCPKHGAAVVCPDGRRGTVVSVTPLTEKVRVRVGDDESFEFCEYDLSDLTREQADGAAPSAQNGQGQRTEKPSDRRPDGERRERGGKNDRRHDRDQRRSADGKNNGNNGNGARKTADAQANGNGGKNGNNGSNVNAGGGNGRNKNRRRNRSKNKHGELGAKPTPPDGAGE